MENITKPSITRLSRKAGIKILTDDSYDVIRNIIDSEIKRITKLAIIVNDETNTKTLMGNDIYNALKLENINITFSNNLGENVCNK